MYHLAHFTWSKRIARWVNILKFIKLQVNLFKLNLINLGIIKNVVKLHLGVLKIFLGWQSNVNFEIGFIWDLVRVDLLCGLKLRPLPFESPLIIECRCEIFESLNNSENFCKFFALSYTATNFFTIDTSWCIVPKVWVYFTLHWLLTTKWTELSYI